MNSSVDEIKNHLESFLKDNPYSDVVEDSEGALSVLKPWGDPAVSIEIPSSPDKKASLFTILNNCILPEKYSAIFHKDTACLEVIWTSYRLNAASAETADRSFVFNFNGHAHNCRFGASTESLLGIAACSSPTSNSTATNYRNLLSFIMREQSSDVDKTSATARTLDVARSFFVQTNGISWPEIDKLIVHLNAFMSYYDSKTPQILIHEPVEKPYDPRDRYLHGRFPEEINGREIDENALAFWREATLSNNEIMRFLTCYRIIEYLAFNFIEVQTRSKIRRILSMPHASSELDRVMSSVVEALSIKNATEDIPKALQLVSSTINMEFVWSEIDRHRDFFCKDTEFDGGYCVKKLIANGDNFETFSNNGVRSILDRLRGIRNALSHGQDQQTRSVIRPTARNNLIIRPWLNLIEIIAAEAMLCRDVV